MAQRAGLKLILLIGSYEHQLIADDFTEMTSTVQTREHFLTEVLGVVEKLNFNGVFFQWCFPGCPQVRVEIRNYF
jgi:GH18 family chitinase